MLLALRPCEDLGDVVQAADEAGAEVESLGPERLAPRLTTLDGVEPGAQNVVDGFLERGLALALLALEPHRDVVVEAEGRSHT